MSDGSDPPARGQHKRLTKAQQSLIQDAETQAMLRRIVARLCARFPGANRDEVVAAVEDVIIRSALLFDPQRGVPFAAYSGLFIMKVLPRWLSQDARKRATTPPTPPEVIEELAPARFFDAIAHVDTQNVLEALPAALATLPVDYQELISMVYEQGLSLVRAAEIIGKSPSATRRLHQDALARLRFELARLGFIEQD